MVGELSKTALDLHASAFVVDLHCDLLFSNRFLRRNWGRRHNRNPLPYAPLMGHVDLPRLQEGGVDLMCLGIVTNPFRRSGGDKAIRRALHEMNTQAALHSDRLVVARTSQQIQRARHAGQISCFAGIEGAHPLHGSLEHLVEYRDSGMGFVGISHFTRNEAACPMRAIGSRPNEPMTAFGLSLVDACWDLGLLVDVAHLNRAGVLQVCERASKPVICSHTVMHALSGSWRGIDDEQALAIARTGGVIGMMFHPGYLGGWGIETLVAHLTYLRDLVGPEHVGIGSDWEGFILCVRGLESVDRLPHLTEALLRAGWAEEHVRQALGDNVLRVIADAVG